MRKLFALLLVCTTLLSLAACGGDTSNWKTKDVAVPKITTEQNGVLVSPLSNTHNQSDISLNIQNLPFMQSATLTHQYLENAIIDPETSHISYDCIDVYKISHNDAYDIVIQYTQNPDSVIGYTAISVEILEYDILFSQNEIYEILRIVYGEQFSEYLCYAKMTQTDHYASSEITVDGMSVIFERAVIKSQGAAFAIGVYYESDALKNSQVKDFSLKAKGFNVFESVLHWNKEDMIETYQHQSSEVLRLHYGENMKLSPALYFNGNLQAYQYSEFEHGYELKIKYQVITHENDNNPLSIQMAMRQENNIQTSAYVLEIESLEDANSTTYTSATEKAKVILRAMLGNQNVDNVFDDGKVRAINVNGQEMFAKCEMVFVQGDNYQIIATLKIQLSTDPNTFVQ